MKLIDFEGRNVIFAENQPEYLQLPAYKIPQDVEGRIVCCWKLSFKERIKLFLFGELWHSILTFNQPLQPQLIETDRPEFIHKEVSKMKFKDFLKQLALKLAFKKIAGEKVGKEEIKEQAKADALEAAREKLERESEKDLGGR